MRTEPLQWPAKFSSTFADIQTKHAGYTIPSTDRMQQDDIGGSAKTSSQFEKKCTTSAYASFYQVFLTSFKQLTNGFLRRLRCGAFTLTPSQTDYYDIYIVETWISSDFDLPRRLHELCEPFDQQDK